MGLNHQKPKLTLFTDASWFQQKKVAGWGGWARGDNRGSVFGSGPLYEMDNVTLLEAQASLNMIRWVKQTGYLLPSDTHVMIQSDSLGFLNALSLKDRTHITKHNDAAPIVRPKKMRDDLKNPVNSIMEELSWVEVVYLRHVRGHKPSHKSGRQWVNNKCDTLAKQAALAQLS